MSVVGVEKLQPMSAAEFDALIRGRLRRRQAYAKVGSPAISEAEGAELLELLEGQDTGALVDDGWLMRLEALVRVEARVAALKATAVAAYDDSVKGVSADLGHDRPEPGDRDSVAGERRWHGGVMRSVSDEVGLVLQVHRSAATRRIPQSWHLVRSYPATHAALAAGELTERAAFAIVDELNALGDVGAAKVREVEAKVLAWARKYPLLRIRQIARREVAKADPGAAERCHRRAKRDRQITLHPTEFGAADLVLSHDGVLSAKVMKSLSEAAIKFRRAGDERTMDQLRADLAINRLLGIPDATATSTTSDHGRAGTSTAGASGGTRASGSNGADSADDTNADADSGAGGGGVSSGGADGRDTADADVVIHATAQELLALLAECRGTGGEVYSPDWLGPLPQAALRDAINRALQGAPVADRLRVHLTDQPPDSDPDRYVPSRALDRWVRDRDRRCRFPGCNRPARYADIDHREAFTAGGRTTAANLHCLCRHHHRLKHRGGWKLERTDNGTCWTSPTGRRYHVDDNDP